MLPSAGPFQPCKYREGGGGAVGSPFSTSVSSSPLLTPSSASVPVLSAVASNSPREVAEYAGPALVPSAAVPVRERDLLQVPHFFVGTLQPLQRDCKRRPRCVGCFLANVQFSLFGLPQGESPGPHMKDQESNPQPHTPRPAALPVKVEQWLPLQPL